MPLNFEFLPPAPAPSWYSFIAPGTFSLLTSGGGAADVTPPVLSGFSPSVGSALEPEDALGFVVTNTGAPAAVVVHVRYPSGLVELAYDKEGFAPLYLDGGGVLTVGAVRTFTISRRGGWPEPPTLSIRATDAAGNEAA